MQGINLSWHKGQPMRTYVQVEVYVILGRAGLEAGQPAGSSSDVGICKGEWSHIEMFAINSLHT